MPFKATEITQNLVLPIWNDHCVDVIDTFVAENAKIHTTFLSGTGPSCLKKSVQDTLKAFPNFKLEISEIIQNENKLMYKWQAKANHEGSILGIPATGIETHFSGIVFGEIENEKITMYQSFSDIPQILQTLQLNPPEDLNLYQSLKGLTLLPLTKREIECLSLWVQGCSIKESAKHMGDLSERTIQTYRENIKHKFAVNSYHKVFSIVQNKGLMPLLLNLNKRHTK